MDRFIKHQLERGYKLTPQAEMEVINERDHLKQTLGLIYESNIELLKRYCVMKEEYYKIVSLWIIGTYVHKQFESYPYLFFNAMRGSGKTRTLKLIKALSKNGKMLASLREAVMFRMDPDTTLAIDEFENIGSEEGKALRELLNACYKKGTCVERVKQVKTAEGNKYVIESYEPYKPVVMANIWGVEEVLGDRAITIILEKSSDQRVNRLIEDFDTNYDVLAIKGILNNCLVQLCSYFGVVRVAEGWNLYINERFNYTTTLTTLSTLTTLTTLREERVVPKIVPPNLYSFYNKIYETGITGRNLELFFPLFQIAEFIGGSALDDIFKIAKDLTKEKREDEMIESRDVLLIDFVARNIFESDYVSIREFTSRFRDFVADDDEKDKWINAKWVGRALKRLCLVTDKRRVKDGIQIRVNSKKALEKMEFFRGEKND